MLAPTRVALTFIFFSVYYTAAKIIAKAIELAILHNHQSTIDQVTLYVVKTGMYIIDVDKRLPRHIKVM